MQYKLQLQITYYKLKMKKNEKKTKQKKTLWIDFKQLIHLILGHLHPVALLG